MDLPLTRGRLNRLCKYFRGGPVHMRYEYNDSQGGRHVRERAVTYDTFTIVGAHGYFHLVFSHEGATVWEQELDVGWEFVGLGKFRLCNSGPYCWFTITK